MFFVFFLSLGVFVFVCMCVMTAKDSLFSCQVPITEEPLLRAPKLPSQYCYCPTAGWVGAGSETGCVLIGLLLEGKEPNICGMLTRASFRVIKVHL